MTELREGDLCSIASGDVFRVAKVLHVDDDAVHVRVYEDQYLTRPVAVDPQELAFAVGHLPLSPEAFESWEPVVFAQADVEPDELDGYELWREAGGGVWGAPEPSLLDRVRGLFTRASRRATPRP